MTTLDSNLVEVLEVKKGRTTYELKKGTGSWVLFSRDIRDKEDPRLTHCMEDLSINLDTYRVHCNRTGKETRSFMRYINLCIRIEKLFSISSLRDL